MEKPIYQKVCKHNTGYAECLHIDCDATKNSFVNILYE
ncbi:MAG: peptide-methionine (S)-S-oxide reductase [Ferruginibacter sp.]|nr:peptide-methionine (S)-S-oxide reductase [Ferruginibacter sp.]